LTIVISSSKIKTPTSLRSDLINENKITDHDQEKQYSTRENCAGGEWISDDSTVFSKLLRCVCAGIAAAQHCFDID